VGVSNLKITSNPFRELRVKAPKKKKERTQGFSQSEAKAILNAALAEANNKRAGEKTRTAGRWIPWLCAYSGARVGEIAQLRKESVRPVEGVPYYWITPEDGDVKDKEPRFVPIHPHLIEQGFLKFVEMVPSGSPFYNAKIKRQSPTEGPAADLRTWVREAAKITDPRVQPNHAWRHTFKNIADSVEIAPKYADMICGHELRTEGEKYSDRLAPVLAREMKKYPRFEVLKLTALP
jgi:integrase